MIRSGILNPQINSLLSRFRHTNRLVIADRGFPYWPELETIDISLVDDVPKVLQVLKAIQEKCVVGKAWMAQEFEAHNTPEVIQELKQTLGDIPLEYEPHDQFKLQVPGTIGLIRTGETTQYANIILESA